MRYQSESTEDYFPKISTEVFEALQRWRGDDQEDWLFLRRHEVIMILDAWEKVKI